MLNFCLGALTAIGVWLAISAIRSAIRKRRHEDYDSY
jgi:hypothetical protein